MVFLLSSSGPLNGPGIVKNSLYGGNAYTSAPHSLMKVSPSALACFEVGAVQRVAVRIPPPTCSTSCSLKARAPRRSNTLFRSFILLSPLVILGPAMAQAMQKFGYAGRSRTRLTADFTNVLISIRRGTATAQGKGPKASIDKVGFRGRQLASTPADQYSCFVIHVWFSFHHWVRGAGPSLAKKSPAALRRSRARLTAHLANVLISIRRRR